MNRWFARLKRESGNASLQSVLVLGVAITITVGFLGLWSSTIRPALHDAAAAHLVPVEAGATSEPGTGLVTPVVEFEDPEPEPVPLDEEELRRKERTFARARGENEPQLTDANHEPRLPERLKNSTHASRANLASKGREAVSNGGPPRSPLP